MSQNVSLPPELKAIHTTFHPRFRPADKREQAFRAVFTCDGSLRIMRPSYPGLRLGNNGDRMTRGLRKNDTGNWAPTTVSTNRILLRRLE